MRYFVACDRIQDTEPAGTAHAVLAGDLSGSTLCGLTYPGPLIFFGKLDWNSLPSDLDRCPVCASRAT